STVAGDRVLQGEETERGDLGDPLKVVHRLHAEHLVDRLERLLASVVGAAGTPGFLRSGGEVRVMPEATVRVDHRLLLAGFTSFVPALQVLSAILIAPRRVQLAY